MPPIDPTRSLSSFEIRERTVRGVVILDLQGGLVGRGATVLLCDAINLLAFEGARSIALNLESVHGVDQTGVDTLLASLATVRACGGELKLLRVPTHLVALLTATPLVGVEAHEHEGALVDSFVLPLVGSSGAPPGAPYGATA